MFLLAGLIALGGIASAVACFTHTVSPTGCGVTTDCSITETHPLIFVGVGVAIAGLMQAALFAAVGLIAKSVGEMRAAAA